MQIMVKEESQTLVSKDPETWLNGGTIRYKLNLKCAHETILMVAGSIYCKSCQNKDMEPEEAASLMMSYEDAKEAREIDESQQS